MWWEGADWRVQSEVGQMCMELGGESRGPGWEVGSNRGQGYRLAEVSSSGTGNWMAGLWPGFAKCRGRWGLHSWGTIGGVRGNWEGESDG